jgi:hypothetical protein
MGRNTKPPKWHGKILYNFLKRCVVEIEVDTPDTNFPGDRLARRDNIEFHVRFLPLYRVTLIQFF